VLGWMPSSQRSTTLASRLGYRLVLMDRPGRGRRWTAPFAYAWLAVRTLALLVRMRPRALVIVAPPFIAPLVAVPVARLLGARTAVDVHSGALLDRRWMGTGPLLRLAARLADGAVVTLPTLAPRVRRNALVIPDPLPRIEVGPLDVEADLVVGVCGWAPDEPIESLIQSANGRPWRLVLTGRTRGVWKLPPNVALAGFLPDDAYHRLLASAACVVVLTTRGDTLLSGLWEAISLERPAVTSDTAALRATFGGAVRYATADAASIRSAIDATLADPGAHGAVRAAAVRFRKANDAALEHLRRLLDPALDGIQPLDADRPTHQPPEQL
jgi:hypothetical protein